MQKQAVSSGSDQQSGSRGMKEAWRSPRKPTSSDSRKQQCNILMQQISASLHKLLPVDNTNIQRS